ncbi:LysR family transcriptional regulator substrate-binding protein [Bacillus megaterium]|nr:LysR family transcriptional regulator substrate-binding protein [Priestia megaterium]
MKNQVELADFKGERLLLSGFVCNYRISLEKSLVEAGVSPDIRLEVNSMSALKEYVQVGFGIAVVPDVMVRNPPPGTEIKRFTTSKLA